MLKIPDSDWLFTCGVPQISVAFLRKRTPQAVRFTQWVQRTHANLLKALEDVLSCCTSGLIRSEIPEKSGWIIVFDALVLLTYSRPYLTELRPATATGRNLWGLASCYRANPEAKHSASAVALNLFLPAAHNNPGICARKIRRDKPLFYAECGRLR